MKKIIIVLTVSFSVVSVYSQNSAQNEYEEWKPAQNEYTNFDIGKYTTPDIVRNLLDIIFDMGSNHSRNGYSYSDRDLRNENSYINGNLSSSFLHFVNTRKTISSLTVNLLFGGSNSSQKIKEKIPNNNFTTIDNMSRLFQENYLLLSWSNKWYFSKLFFMDYGINSNMAYTFTQNKTKNQSEDSNQKRKQISINVSPQLGAGYGRIENVQDARQAVYIANALSKKNVLIRKLTNDELFEMSQIISTVKNKRFLDSRLHLIDEITSLDSFFESNNLLADNGAAYFTTLYDMWQYGDLFSRKSGYEISIVASPNYGYENLKYTPDVQETINHSNQHIVSLNFSYEKPVKLNWQHSLLTDVSGIIFSSSNQNKQMNNDYKDTTKYKAISAFANYSLGYYPNTRTNIQVTASQQISKNIYDDEGNSVISKTTLNAKLYYYFSPNLRLEGNCGIIYSTTRENKNEAYYSNRNIFSSLFNIQLTYSIF